MRGTHPNKGLLSIRQHFIAFQSKPGDFIEAQQGPGQV